MKKVITAVSLAAMGLISTGANAEGMDLGAMYTKCGIGGAIFTETSWAAASSNIIFDLGTTAVISGLSSPSTCSGKNVRTAMLINDSYAQIEAEAVEGKGDTLAALEAVSGCSTANLRGDLAAADTGDGKKERVEAIYNSVMSTCTM